MGLTLDDLIETVAEKYAYVHELRAQRDNLTARLEAAEDELHDADRAFNEAVRRIVREKAGLPPTEETT